MKPKTRTQGPASGTQEASATTDTVNTAPEPPQDDHEVSGATTDESQISVKVVPSPLPIDSSNAAAEPEVAAVPETVAEPNNSGVRGVLDSGVDLLCGGGMTYDEKEMLLAANAPLVEIEAVDTKLRNRAARTAIGAKKKVNNPALLEKHAAEMMASKSGRYLWAAGAYGDILVARGYHAPVKGHQGWGDAAGVKGMQLAFVTIGGRKFYSLLSIGMSVQEKQQHQEKLEKLRPEALALLMVDVGD